MNVNTSSKVKKRLIPKSLKKKDIDNDYLDHFEGAQDGDSGITLPNKIEVSFIIRKIKVNLIKSNLMLFST